MSGTGSQRDASGARGFAADSERAERTDRTERTERTGPRLLVRAPSWLGDFCMAEPTLAAVDAACAQWTLVAPRRFLELVAERFPRARRVAAEDGANVPARVDSGGAAHGSDDGSWSGSTRSAVPGPGSRLDTGSAHASTGRPGDDSQNGEGLADRGDPLAGWRGHDAALLLDGSLRSVWRALRAGIPERVCWDSSLRGLLATRAPRPAREAGGTALGLGRRGAWPRRLPRPFGSACAELAGLLGIPMARREPRLAATERDREAARARLAAHGVDPDAPFLLVNLGGAPGSAKTPPRATWSALLARRDGLLALPRVLVCGPGEEARARALGEEARGQALTEPGVLLDDPPPSLGELLALAELARHGLTPDSGPRHLMAAAGLELTVLFGSTDPRHTAEATARTRVVRGSAPCTPCHSAACAWSDERARSCHAPAADVRVESARTDSP